MNRFNPDMTGEPAVELNAVSLRYDTADEVLSDVNIRLRPGSFTFLTGASGAGKSSLLKLIYLAHAPTRGEVRLFGQSTGMLKHLTSFENVALPLRVLGQKPEQYRDEVADLLRWVGLGERMHALPQSLSGGEQQRLSIARALINKPNLLVADEPTGNVDPEMGKRIFRLFVELNRRLNTTVIIATHDLGLIREFEAPVLRLQHGLIVQDVEHQPA